MITNYNQLPIGKYKKLVEIAKRGNLTEDEQNIAIVAVLADMTEEEVEAMPYVEMRALCAKAGFIYEQPPTTKPKTRYKIGRFDCEVQTKPEKLSTAQYTDFKQLASVADDKPEVVLSIFLVPRGQKYCDGYDIEELQQAINDHLPIGQGLSILAFFFAEIATFDRKYANLFGLDDEGGDDERKGREEGADEGEAGGADGGDPFLRKWGWTYNVATVARATLSSWDSVYQMTAVEFLNRLAYLKDETAYNKRMEEQWRRAH